jgi:hypothetical protein
MDIKPFIQLVGAGRIFKSGRILQLVGAGRIFKSGRIFEAWRISDATSIFTSCASRGRMLLQNAVFDMTFFPVR